MPHSHSQHSHHSHIPSAQSDGRLASAFYWAIGLNLAYVVLEAAFGFTTGSMGLLSDAGHNLSDVASLLIAFIAYKASFRKATPEFSYGYGRATVEASLLNAIILYAAVIFILVESVSRLLRPLPVDGSEIAWIAGVGVAVNGITAWMLMRESGKDLNVKGAFLHMAADTLVSIGVVISGIIINLTGWTWLDPAVGIVIAVVIAVGSWGLLHESLHLSLDGVPPQVDISKIEDAIRSVRYVKSFHHLHVWALSTSETAATVHVIVKDPADIDSAIDSVRKALRKAGIGHATIEAESTPHDCGSSGLDEQLS